MVLEGEYPEIPGHRITGRLGWGGMGTVYMAEEMDLGRKVAIKVIPSSWRWGHFRREMEALGRLRDPGIVTLYRHGQTADVYYYTMELIEGETLATRQARLRPDGPPRGEDLRREVRLVLGAARAISHAHSQGVYHRDLSPSNILVLPDGSVKVIDFGLAQVADLASVTRSGSVMGTPRYLSPEALLGATSRSDPLQDLYALGAILFEAASLSHPYPHQTAEELLFRVDSSEPYSPRRANRAIPRDLEAVILKAVARRPEDRYRDLDMFVADLEAFLAGRSVEARRAISTTRVRSALRRNSLLVSCSLLGLLLALFAGGGYSIYLRLEQKAVADRHLAEARRLLLDAQPTKGSESTDFSTALLEARLAGELGRTEEARRIEQAVHLAEAILEYRRLHGRCEALAGNLPPASAGEDLEELGRLRDEALRLLEEPGEPLVSYLR